MNKRFFTLAILVFLLNNSWSQESYKRLRYGAGLIYTPSYTIVQQTNSGDIDKKTFESITNEEKGKIVHPVSLYFSYDPIEILRLKLGFGSQFFGYKSPVYQSQLENSEVKEVSFKVSNRYFQIPFGVQLFVTKSIYIEASYVSLLLIDTKQETLTMTDSFENRITYISRKGFESYNQVLDFSVGYQARLGESSISLQLAPKLSYSPSFAESPSSQIRRTNWQFGLSLGIHSFL